MPQAPYRRKARRGPVQKAVPRVAVQTPGVGDDSSRGSVLLFQLMKQQVRHIELRSRIERLAAVGPDFTTVRALLDRELRVAVGYDFGALSTLDPATMCWTSCFVSGADHDGGFERIVYDHEFRAHEVNSYSDLARAGRPVGRLAAATDGDLARVGRYSDLLEPLDAADEMRAVLRSHGACWGTLTLYRQHPRPAFTLDDELTVAAAAPLIADLFRLTMLSARPPRPTRHSSAPVCSLLRRAEKSARAPPRPTSGWANSTIVTECHR